MQNRSRKALSETPVRAHAAFSRDPWHAQPSRRPPGPRESGPRGRGSLKGVAGLVLGARPAPGGERASAPPGTPAPRHSGQLSWIRDTHARSASRSEEHARNSEGG